MMSSRRRRASSICSGIDERTDAIDCLVMNGRRELAWRRRTKSITLEIDLRGGAGLLVEIEQEVADGAALDRCDQTGDRLRIFR